MPKHPPHVTDSILNKWKAQGGFIRFLDGDTSNCAVHNLTRISFAEALQHWDEWRFDWDMNLTRKEIKCANDPEWRAGLRVTPARS